LRPAYVEPDAARREGDERRSAPPSPRSRCGAMMRLPRAIAPGDVVGVFAPSSPGARLYPDRFRRGLRALSSCFRCEVRLPHDFEQAGDYAAGRPEDRAQAFLELALDSDVRAIFTTYGGHNSSDLLPLLPRDELLRTAPKAVVGYSDTTALLLGYQALTGAVTYYGPAVLPQFGEYPEPFEYTLASARSTLMLGEGGAVEDPGFWTDEFLDWGKDGPVRARRVVEGWREPWRKGEGEGVLFGGNLSTANYLIGTPYFGPPPGPLVLFFECTGEDAKLPALRRALMQLVNCGLMDRVTAMLVGRSPHNAPRGETGLRELVLDVFGDYRFPILGQLPFGHTDPMVTLPIGCQATLSIRKDRARLEVIGPTASASEERKPHGV